MAIPGALSAQDKRGQETGFERQLRERDNQPVRNFVQSKDAIDLKEKAKNLEISGDVRFEWRQLFEHGDYIYFESGDAEPLSSDNFVNIQNEKFAQLQAEGKIPDRVVGLQDPSNRKFKQKYQQLRGPGCVDYRNLPISNNDWDVEFNLKFKYSFEKAWMAAHLNFDNSCGVKGLNDCKNNQRVHDLSDLDDSIEVTRNGTLAVKGSGEQDRINLKRAYMGYNVWADGDNRFDIEVGRRKLEDAFDSEIQFSNRFDGILFKYATDYFGDKGDFYWNLGLFIIDERVNNVGYVTEFGLLNIYDTGLDLKYSFIDWTKRGVNRCFVRNPLGTDYMNSQISFEYHFRPEIFCKTVPAQFYGEFLLNHAARKTVFTHYKKENFAWHLGLYVGEVKKKGDWALDIEYVYIQAQAVSDFDVGSIGRGNILNELLTDVIYDSKNSIDGDVIVILDENNNVEDIIPVNGKGDLSNLHSSSFSSGSSGQNSASDQWKAVGGILPRRGNANFKGWKVDFLYGLTDNISLDVNWEYSTAVNDKIGGSHKYMNYEIEAIYAF